MNRQEKHAYISKILQKANAKVRYPKNFEAPFAIEAWLDSLEAIPLGRIKEAFESLTAKGEFPSLAEIKIHIYDQEHKTVSGIEAFGSVWGKLNRNEKPHLDDLVEMTITRLGGWNSICETWSVKDKQWHSHDFVREYDKVKLDAANGGEVHRIERTGDKTHNPLTSPSKIKTRTLSALERAQESCQKGHTCDKLDQLYSPGGTIDLTKLSATLNK